MSLRRLLASSSLSAILLITSAANATPTPPSDPGCTIAGYTPTQVVEYRVSERIGRGRFVQRMAGAKVFIPAQQGLSKELVGANVIRHLRAMEKTTMGGCPLDMDRISVTVTSGTTGYWVEIGSKDRDSAKEILARARRLVHRA